MANIRNIIRKIAERMTGRKILIAKDSGYSTAALSKYGFWYAGNLFDTADIAYGISQNGLVEKEETELVISTLDAIVKEKGGISLFDIGANTGYYGILAGHRYGQAKVNSFEPISRHVEWLKQSVYLNRLESVVQVHQIALGSENKEETIYVAGSGTSLSEEFIQGQFESTETVQVRKLDDMTGASGSALDAPDFIKIDVEGYEQSVLEGAKNTLAASKPVLYIEIAKTLKNLGRADFASKSYENTFALLAEMGYEAFITEGPSVVPFDPSLPFDGVRMYLFLHKDTHGNIKSALNIK